MVKINYFFTPIFIIEEGKVFIDYENINKDDKISFKRYPINKDIETKEELQKEIDKLGPFLKQNKISLTQKPYLTSMRKHGKSKNINEVELIYFLFVENNTQIKNIDGKNQWMQIGDFIVDEEITWMDRLEMNDFINGLCLPVNLI